MASSCSVESSPCSSAASLKAAQQRTPVIIRTERPIGDRFVVVLPVASQLLLETRHRLVGPRPVPQQAGEAVDGQRRSTILS